MAGIDRPWLLVPVKSIRLGKSRLQAALTDEQRRAMACFLIRRAIDVAGAYPGLDRALFITDAEDTLDFVASCGARVMRQLTNGGLNAAVEDGIRQLYAEGVRGVIVAASDIPLVTPDDFADLVSAAAREYCIICRDAARTGTNAIYLPRPASMKFHFGPDSYLRHSQEVRRQGFTQKPYENYRIAADIDLPEDLPRLLECPRLPPGISRIIHAGSGLRVRAG
ncbi:MAG: 2-phospho-L-lactate guanylyltransferase [Parvibaculaceae bacterium]